MLRQTVPVGKGCYAGLTVEDGFCKYLLLERADGRLRAVKSLSVKIGAEDGGYEALFQLLNDCGARKDVPISFSLPCNDVLLRIIDMPGYTLQEVKSVIRYRFDDYFPFAYDESRFDAAEIKFQSGRGDATRFIAAVSRRRVIDEISLCATAHGFTLSGIEPAQMSFERAVAYDGGYECVINLYAGRKNLLFVISNLGNGIFYRNSAIKADGGEYIDRVVDEAKLSLEFASSRMHDFAVERITIAGPNVGESLIKAVGNALGISRAKEASPFADNALTCAACADSEMILPLGTALSQL